MLCQIAGGEISDCDVLRSVSSFFEDLILPLDSRLEVTSIPRFWCSALEKAGKAAFNKMPKKEKNKMKNRPPPF